MFFTPLPIPLISIVFELSMLAGELKYFSLIRVISALVSTKNEPLLLINSGECNVETGGCLPELKHLIVAHKGKGSDAIILVELLLFI